jgi:hypothetical protein
MIKIFPYKITNYFSESFSFQMTESCTGSLENGKKSLKSFAAHNLIMSMFIFRHFLGLLKIRGLGKIWT